MYPEVAIAKLLSEIAEDSDFIYAPDRRDQIERTATAIVSSQLISTATEATLRGDAKLDRSRVQVTITSPVKSKAIKAAKQIRDSLSGFRGPVSTSDYGVLFVCDCLFVGGRALYNPTSDGGEAGDYAHAIDFELSMSE